MKRTISLLLALALVMSLLPMVGFAADAPRFSLSADKTTVKAGETINVTLTLEQDIADVSLCELYIQYDTSLFTRGEATLGTALPEINVSQKNIALDGTELKNDGTDAAMQKFTIFSVLFTSKPATAGTVAVIPFTAKENITAATPAQFTPEFYLLQDGNFQDIPATVGAPLDVTVQTADYQPGYTVSMGADQSIIAGEEVSIPVTVGHNGDQRTYNAFDLSFSYDAAVLELLSTTIEGLTVTTGTGSVRVQGYGTDRAVDTAPVALRFRAHSAGSGAVTLLSAKVDRAANAISNDAPEATVLNATTTVTVSGYPVTLPENFSGASVALPGQDYSFSEPEDYYDYTVTVTVGGTPVEVVKNADGSYTIPGEKVTGPIVVSAERSGKRFNVTLGTDMSGAATAQYMTDYSATLNAAAGFTYSVSVTIAGRAYTGYRVSNGVYTIPGADVTGDIVFTVVKTEIPREEYTVTFEGSGAGDATGAAIVTEGSDYSFTLTQAPGYTYTVSATMGGKPVELRETAGLYTIAAVSGNLVITIEKTAALQLAVTRYVELDGKTIFLVTVEGTPGEGKAYAYNGSAMFYSEVYEAWCYLTIESGEFSEDDARAQITVTESAFTTLRASTDVNRSGRVDVNDAQLVYDIYNGTYTDFSTVEMLKFLLADVNGDRSVNVTDAAAVIAAIG